jgi:hypothetical protein
VQRRAALALRGERAPQAFDPASQRVALRRRRRGLLAEPCRVLARRRRRAIPQRAVRAENRLAVQHRALKALDARVARRERGARTHQLLPERARELADTLELVGVRRRPRRNDGARGDRRRLRRLRSERKARAEPRGALRILRRRPRVDTPLHDHRAITHRSALPRRPQRDAEWPRFTPLRAATLHPRQICRVPRVRRTPVRRGIVRGSEIQRLPT